MIKPICFTAQNTILPGIALALVVIFAPLSWNSPLAKCADTKRNKDSQDENKKNIKISMALKDKRSFFYVGGPVVLNIDVSNSGPKAVANVTVHFPLPGELEFRSATDSGTLVVEQGKSKQRVIVWKLANLEPGKHKLMSVSTKAEDEARELKAIAHVTADGNVEMTAEVKFEIRARPVMLLEVIDTDDPVLVGEHTTYVIQISNRGTNDLHHVRVKAIVPDQLQVVEAKGHKKPEIKGQIITFPFLDRFEPEESRKFTIEVKALKPGDVRFRVEVQAKEFPEPIVEEEATTIFDKPRERS